MTKLFRYNYNHLDTRMWVQKVILKKYLKKINNHVKPSKKDTLNSTYTLIENH